MFLNSFKKYHRRNKSLVKKSKEKWRDVKRRFKSGKMTVLMLYDSSCRKIFDSNLFIIKVIYFEGRYVL